MELSVIVHPNSRKPRIESDMLNDLHVYVREPHLEGKANIAVTKALSKHFKVSKSAVQLTSGFKSKKKTFRIETK
ncbi:DUF167 domain-containing protein [candidate division WWE3 bacterium]|jgi:uncharacterized protein|nr:DUF167 domain-containing protein [candidate division WWE3 bacterium]MBT7349297.1 DUF167 domain-containing protein [candidate division WWE3 bacterium]